MTLRFHRSLYEPQAVERAVARFSATGRWPDLRVEAHAHDMVVVLPEGAPERLGDELGNHALFETIVARRA